MLVHACIHQYILAYTSMYCALRHWNFFEIRRWIHHCTRQYMEVRKSPVPLNETVQGSTRTSYCLVQSCLVSCRGTGHLGTVLRLQCTALYRICVYTSMYQHVPIWLCGTSFYHLVLCCIHIQTAPLWCGHQQLGHPERGGWVQWNLYTNMTLWYFIVPPCTMLYPHTDSSVSESTVHARIYLHIHVYTSMYQHIPIQSYSAGTCCGWCIDNL